jgi:hypothetical protein
MSEMILYAHEFIRSSFGFDGDKGRVPSLLIKGKQVRGADLAKLLEWFLKEDEWIFMI